MGTKPGAQILPVMDTEAICMPGCIKLPWPYGAPQSIWLLIVASPCSRRPSRRDEDVQQHCRHWSSTREALAALQGS